MIGICLRAVQAVLECGRAEGYDGRLRQISAIHTLEHHGGLKANEYNGTVLQYIRLQGEVIAQTDDAEPREFARHEPDEPRCWEASGD